MLSVTSMFSVGYADFHLRCSKSAITWINNRMMISMMWIIMHLSMPLTYGIRGSVLPLHCNHDIKASDKSTLIFRARSSENTKIFLSLICVSYVTSGFECSAVYFHEVYWSKYHDKKKIWKSVLMKVKHRNNRYSSG